MGVNVNNNCCHNLRQRAWKAVIQMKLLLARQPQARFHNAGCLLDWLSQEYRMNLRA